MSDDPGGSSSANSACPGGPNIGNNNNNNNNIRANDHKSKASLLQQLLSADWISRWHFSSSCHITWMHNVISCTCAVNNRIRYLIVLVSFILSINVLAHVLCAITSLEWNCSIAHYRTCQLFPSHHLSSLIPSALHFEREREGDLLLLLLLLLQISIGMMKWEVRKKISTRKLNTTRQYTHDADTDATCICVCIKWWMAMWWVSSFTLECVISWHLSSRCLLILCALYRFQLILMMAGYFLFCWDTKKNTQVIDELSDYIDYVKSERERKKEKMKKNPLAHPWSLLYPIKTGCTHGKKQVTLIICIKWIKSYLVSYSASVINGNWFNCQLTLYWQMIIYLSLSVYRCLSFFSNCIFNYIWEYEDIDEINN